MHRNDNTKSEGSQQPTEALLSTAPYKSFYFYSAVFIYIYIYIYIYIDNLVVKQLLFLFQEFILLFCWIFICMFYIFHVGISQFLKLKKNKEKKETVTAREWLYLLNKESWLLLLFYFTLANYTHYYFLISSQLF
jgi:hypothetical protein